MEIKEKKMDTIPVIELVPEVVIEVGYRWWTEL